ncbi:MAG: hypothetical protein COC17_08295 [Hyphomicrobiales bacterium]|nr:hypothetical protein [Hyphomicrobiales bacterium]PCH49529.1 MAG: hypothetical protein COC17_08295 [Hyphomicrobiales bacterium]
MQQTKLAQQLIVDDSIDIQTLFELNNSPTKDALDVASKLTALQRAKVAQFCYARVHMRKMGLHIAATCELPELLEVFGAGAKTILKQSRDVEETLTSLKKSQSQYTKKPVSLRVVAGSTDIDSDSIAEEFVE